MTSKVVEKYCPLEEAAEKLIRQAVSKMRLSARSYHKILKVSRTIADLGGVENIVVEHISEALNYRPKGRYDTGL